MSKRRANGEGSVFKLKDGSWRATCPGGRPSFRGSTRDEAMRRRSAYLAANQKILHLPKSARDSFAAIISQWLESRRNALRPRTLESYHETATRHIIPVIGAIPVGKLTPDDIIQAMATGKSVRTKNYIRTVCHMALEYAMRRDTVTQNVAHKVEPLVSQRAEREMPSPEQWTALLGAIDTEAAPTRALILVIAFCGLRVGEACGLRWRDYEDRHLRIVRAADRNGNLVPVKTAAGRRIVPVGKVVAAALDQWRENQDALRAGNAPRWRSAETPDLMFTTRYGTPLSQRNVLRAVYRVTDKAGLGRRSVHYLRHLAISHLVADPELDMKTIQVIAGHSSIRVTYDTYGHLMPGRLQKAADAMDRRSG